MSTLVRAENRILLFWEKQKNITAICVKKVLIKKGRIYKMTNLILKRQLQKNKKKGFTLIELIVVIVIIAIIAAIAVPALTRYIQSAEKRAVQATAHNIQLVLQAEATENYNISFPAGPSASDVTLYTKTNPTPPPANITVTPELVLTDNGIQLQGMVLAAITYSGSTLTGFTLTRPGSPAIVVTYNNLTGFTVTP